MSEDPVTVSATPPAQQPKTNWAARGAGALALLAALVCVYVVFAATSKPQDGASLTRFATGPLSALEVVAIPPPQPDTPILNAAGRPVRLSDWRGQVLVVNFWASWCEPCKEEMPSLAALHERFAARGARVVAVSVDKPAAEALARRQLAEWGTGALEFFIDHNATSAINARSAGFPTTIIYDRRGREIARLTGPADWNSSEAHALIEAALAR